MSALAFVLSMPNRASWNGGWSGEGECYAIVKTLGMSKAAQQKHDSLAGRSFYHHFGDGWSACVECRSVNAQEARSLRKRSRGFCGYDWMVRNILVFGDTSIERAATTEEATR